jgi:hypothetical protein
MTDQAPAAVTAPDAPAPETEEEEDDALPALESIGRDYDFLNKRVQTKLREVRNAGAEVGVETLLSFVSELATILMDHVTHTKRMEDHAVWASETIEQLSDVLGDGERASQLDPSDADKYKAFLDAVIADLDQRLGAAVDRNSDSDAPLVERLTALRTQATELRALTDDITLNPADEPDEPSAPEASPDE